MTDDDRPVTLAVVVGAHGVGGEVRLKLFTDSIDGLKRHKSFNDDALRLRSVRDGPHGAIACFAEVPDRSAADRLRGVELTVPRAALPVAEEGEYYHADLIGLSCEDGEGALLGAVVAVENFGAGDILEIEKPDGRRTMIPFRDGIADLRNGRIVADPAFLA